VASADREITRVRWIANLVAVLSFAVCHGSAFAEEPAAVAIIETYGLHAVSREAVLEAAGVRVGDPAPDASQIKSIIRKLEGLRSVERADAVVILTPRANGPAQRILYLGIREAGRPAAKFRAAPTGDVELPAVVRETYREFERTLQQSTQAGNFSEDDSNGYALLGDESARAVQKRFVPLASEHGERLLDVLQSSRNVEDRAMAAWIVGYATDRQQAAQALATAARDPAEDVRNNAMRGLGVLVGYASAHPDIKIDIPTDWLLAMLESVRWTDRNKALSVLLQVPAEHPVMARLREQSLPTLVEMARWNADAHALMPFLLIGRVAGMSDTEVLDAWTTGRRDEVINRAMPPKPGREKMSE
jgi:hypothetical protein